VNRISTQVLNNAVFMTSINEISQPTAKTPNKNHKLTPVSNSECYNYNPKGPDVVKIGRQLNNLDRYEQEVIAKNNKREEMIIRKERNYEKWVKEMRAVEKGR
jgi:hypothetical protein